jgi:hypothetical protein
MGRTTMQIETTFTAAQLQHHLRQLYAERSLAEVAGLTSNPGYMADLLDDITAYEEAFTGVAITEIATLRAELGGVLQG